MKQVKYVYNTQTLGYEKYEEPFRMKVLRAFGWMSATVVFAFVVIYLAYTYLDSPKEKELRRELSEMQLQYDILNKKLDQMQSVMGDLQNRDDNVYRVIFEAEPIPAEVRQAGVGGVDRYKDLINYDNGVLMASTSAKLDKIRREMYIQSQSYDQLAGMIKNKEAVLSSIPAIMPISNKDLTHIASGFGTRIDPIYKIPKMHEGLDFAAPIGTPVYATGNGVISDVEYGYSGYGNNILINHMVGYQTHYCHLSKIVVKEGQQVKRGDLIGYVGSTGKSTGPHLHYEVIKDGVKIDPAYFFFNDLSPLQYETMLKMASQSNQSFD